MNGFEFENLLSEITAEAPCGEDLSYDPAYLALEGLIHAKPADGGILGEGESITEPKFSDICSKSLELLERSKDLRVVIYLTVALLSLEGIQGLCKGLFLLRRLLELFWDHIHPQLDPEDNNDPLERINVLLSLSPPTIDDHGPINFRRRLLEASLCSSTRMGQFSFRDIQIAKGELTIPDGQETDRVDVSVIEAAFQDTSIEQLQATFRAANESIEHIRAITDVFSKRANQGQSPDLSGIQTILTNISKCLQGYLEKLGQVTTLSQDGAEAGENKGKTSLSGQISTPKEALLAIEKVCQYFERHEPSSPVPLLLRRAQRLVSKSFLEVIQDFCPDAMNQIEMIGGTNSSVNTGKPTK